MMRLTGMLLGLCLSACSVSHDIKIPVQPCFYPLKNYDFTLCQDFRFAVDGRYRTVPKGFTTDLASIPRILWSIYSPNKAETIPAAVIHDFFYFCPNHMTRKEADSIFYDALIMEGFSKRSAYKYWAAVRLFGKSHFNEGARCHHAYTRTEDTISYLRMAYTTASTRC